MTDEETLLAARSKFPDAPSDRCAVAAFAGLPHAVAVFEIGEIGLAEHRWLQKLLSPTLLPRVRKKWPNRFLRPLRSVEPLPPEPKGHLAELADGWLPEWVKVPT